jgi:hypothetical protein
MFDKGTKNRWEKKAASSKNGAEKLVIYMQNTKT